MHIEVVRTPEALNARPHVAQAIDTLGQQSAIAQTLSHAITSVKLFATPQATEQRQMLLLAVEHGQYLGFLKTGIKHLFYVTPSGKYVEMDPLCVLDFYVATPWQRRGVGLQLFQHLLQEERVTPAQLAYDRPSPRLFSFLEKQAKLTQYVPQPNQFVIFDAYFSSRQ